MQGKTAHMRKLLVGAFIALALIPAGYAAEKHASKTSTQTPAEIYKNIADTMNALNEQNQTLARENQTIKIRVQQLQQQNEDLWWHIERLERMHDLISNTQPEHPAE